jgi:hypothetical protein
MTEIAKRGMKVLKPSAELQDGFQRSASSSPPIGSSAPATKARP